MGSPVASGPVPHRGERARTIACVAALLVLPSLAAPDPADFCPPLPPPGGAIVRVSSVAALVDAVNGAAPGTTILIADGYYALNGAYLRIAAPGVTLRSESGNREAVVLDGDYVTTEIVQVVASSVTIAGITLREAYYHPIHVTSSDGAATNGTLIYDVHIVDPGEQAIKINPANASYFTDDGVVACSRIELTAAGRAQIRNNCYTGGVDAHASRGWVIRDNEIEGFWCETGLSEHAVHMWRSCRDTRVERNRLSNNARGVGFGMATSGTGRTYPDNPCPAAGGGYVDHYGGTASNNFVSATDAGLFSSEYGFDCGICLWQACGAQVLHNSVHTADSGATFSSIEWRFPYTSATITNNLVNATMRERDGAAATLAGNLTAAQTGWYVAAASGDLHLVPAATAAIDHGVATILTGDIDGDVRPSGSAPDVGADERASSASLSIGDVTVSEGGSAASSATLSDGSRRATSRPPTP